MTTFLAIALIVAAIGFALVRALVETVIVQEYERVLLVRNGVVTRSLEPGRHFVWSAGAALERYDLRQRRMTLGAQEVTTSDQVPVKVTATLTYRLADPEKLRIVSSDFIGDLYAAAQIALREVLTRWTMEELLQDASVAEEPLTTILREPVEELGLTLETATVLDVIVRGELKKALTESVLARAEARAKLEQARGETAVLRNLANAARLLSEHEGLARLRLIEVARTAAEARGNTLVMGLDELERGVLKDAK